MCIQHLREPDAPSTCVAVSGSAGAAIELPLKSLCTLVGLDPDVSSYVCSVQLLAEADAERRGLVTIRNVMLRADILAGPLRLNDLSVSGPFERKCLSVHVARDIQVESGAPAAFTTDVNSLSCCENGCKQSLGELQIRLADAARNQVLTAARWHTTHIPCVREAVLFLCYSYHQVCKIQVM